MTGYRSSHFRWNCRLKGCYYEQLPDWDDLLGSFPRKIKPTDVDGLVEIGNNFLFMEQKGPGVPIPEAQRLALRRISQREGITTVFFRPPVSAATDLECLIFGQGPTKGWETCSRTELQGWLREWATDADAHHHSDEGSAA